MSFRDQADLLSAMEWFKQNAGKEHLLPKPTLVRAFDDDHISCIQVKYTIITEFTFWWIGDGMFAVARSDVDKAAAMFVWKWWAEHLEEAATTGRYTYWDGHNGASTEVNLTPTMIESIQDFRKQVADWVNSQGA